MKMSTIVTLLLFGAIYSIVYVVKNLASPPGDAGRKVFGENFPSVEILEPDESVPVSPSAEPARTPDGIGQQRHRPAKPVAPSAPDKKPQEQVVKERKERLVKLQNRSEAKRAFLYSEIFNRKY